MTATTVERLINMTAPLAPAHGTFPIAANTLLLKGTIATLDSSDRLAVPGAGLDAVGALEATYRNRTTDPSGGAAGALDGEVRYGVHGWLISGTTPRPRQVVYVVDNQTVSADGDGGRGIAGICSEVRTENGVAKAYVYMGPHVVGMIRGGADIEIPIGSFRLTTGAALPAFAGGSADGYAFDGSEAFGIRFNDDTTGAIVANVRVPEQIPNGLTATLRVLAYRTGATDTAVALLTPAVFRNREGVAYDAGASLVSGNFGVMAGATKVVTELTKALDTTDVQGGDVLTVTLTPITANLANDDLTVIAAFISLR